MNQKRGPRGSLSSLMEDIEEFAFLELSRLKSKYREQVAQVRFSFCEETEDLYAMVSETARDTQLAFEMDKEERKKIGGYIDRLHAKIRELQGDVERERRSSVHF